ncbi:MULTISPECIES: large conductance mechanosensitive channel protein MscL [unclassified Microbacterium]|uniref:large conductance mechanosensitive channel protein MscL n=1 Tax=unclassified Microbacterium TaxID=2609290 RepID=UPI00365836AE
MIKGFKEFITRGNVIDLAVAVVIGAAFTAIINTIVESFINPLIGALVPSGDLAKWTITIPGIFADAHFGIGAIIAAIINFVAVALVVYLFLVMPMNKFKDRQAAKAGVVEAPEELPSEQVLLIQIRDLLEKQKSA